MYHRYRPITTAIFALALLSIAADVSARQGLARPRAWLSAWAGGFTDRNNGFSDGEDDFYSFGRSIAVGAGFHFAIGGSLTAGVDAVWTKPDYTHFIRSEVTAVGEGQATLTSAIASVRLQGSPGLLGLYLTGGLGMFRWDVPELEPNTDFALDAGIGIDYTLRSRFWLFLQYDQWWIYHEKVGEVVKNTVNRNTIRFGTRLGLF